MRILTANLCSWGEGELSIPNRMPRVKEIFRKYAPDVIGVQESTDEWSAFLKESLNDYLCFGLGREPGFTGEASHIFIKKDFCTVGKTGTFWLSETPETVSLGWDGACRRVCTYIICQKNGNSFALVNTHLDHIGEIAQIKGTELIAKKIDSLNIPAVLTGDFNVTEKSLVYRTIKSKLKDARYSCEHNETTGTWHNFGEKKDMENELSIDHIFLSESLKCKSYRIIKDRIDEKYVSDHYFVMAEIEI